MSMLDLLWFNSLYNMLAVFSSIMTCITVTLYILYRRTRTKTLSPPLTPLQELNKEFRSQYENARANFWHTITDHGTVIIAKGSSLTLIHHGTRYSPVIGIPKIYHDVKSIAHIPITVYMMLNNKPTISSDDSLKRYLEKMNSIELPDSIQSKGLESAQNILNRSRTLIEKAIQSEKSIDRDQLVSYCQTLSTDLFTLLDIAAMAQLDQMNDIIQAWFNQYGINQRDPTLKVLIISSRTARENNLQTNYFERLLGSDQKENIIFIEELFQDEKKAISMTSTWFFDAQLSETFFKDRKRMHRDLLMNDHVQDYLVSLVPEQTRLL